MIQIKNQHDMEALGQRIGEQLKGGEVIELVGDVGAGKTTFVRGLARGMGVDESVASPSFTINRMYDGKNQMKLAHYDFYRLQEPGIMATELGDIINEKNTVVVVEWATSVQQILPPDRLILNISTPTESERIINLSGGESLKLDSQVN